MNIVTDDTDYIEHKISSDIKVVIMIINTVLLNDNNYMGL